MTLIKQSKTGVLRSNIQNGCGDAYVFSALPPNAEGAIKFASRIELQPGGIIGLHCHAYDEETYAVMSGEGRFESDDGECAALPGDIFVTKKGMSHGLRNTGDVPLIFFAVVASEQIRDTGSFNRTQTEQTPS